MINLASILARSFSPVREQWLLWFGAEMDELYYLQILFLHMTYDPSFAKLTEGRPLSSQLQETDLLCLHYVRKAWMQK